MQSCPLSFMKQAYTIWNILAQNSGASVGIHIYIYMLESEFQYHFLAFSRVRNSTTKNTFLQQPQANKPCGHIGGTVFNIRKCGVIFYNITCFFYFYIFLLCFFVVLFSLLFLFSCFLFLVFYISSSNILCYVSIVPTNKKTRSNKQQSKKNKERKTTRKQRK